MKRHIRPLLAMLLTLAMLLSAVSGLALADEITGTITSGETVTALPETDGEAAPITGEPTEEPTEAPAEEPVEESTEEPTEAPAEEPTEEPTGEPTEEPAEKPTGEPTEEPAEEPAGESTEAPTEELTGEPTAEPTEAPALELTEDGIVLDTEQFIQLLALADVSPAANDETLRQKLKAETGVSTYTYFGSADFDGDGVGEAFAVLNVPIKNADYMSERKLAFVTESGVKYLQTNETYEEKENDPFQIYDLDDVCLFAAKKYGTSASITYVWAVENGDVVDLSKQFEGSFTHEGGNLFTVTDSQFDGSTDGTGHTWKPYYYFYENKQLKEYGGITISKDELLEFEGAKEIIDGLAADGKTITGIIYRSNGLIHINCQKPAGNVRDNSYVTLKYDATSVTKASSGGGLYKTANGTNAVYPEKFVHPTKEPCAHQNTHKEENSDKRKYTYLPLSDKPGYHSVSVTKTYKMYCDDCSSYIGEAFTEVEELADAAHNYVNGVCDKCGEVQPTTDCDHSNKNYNDVLDESVALTYANINESTHCVQRSYKRYCADCEAFIENVTKADEPVAHDFGEDDVCECGYCKHIELEKRKSDTTVEYQRIDGDAEYHKTTRTTCYGMYCKACGKLISSLDPVVTTGKEKHVYKDSGYNNGVSKCVCGTSNYENATKGAYYEALKMLEGGENPLEDSRVRILMRSELLRIGYSEEYVDEIITRAAAAPEVYRDIFVYSFFEYERCNSGNPDDNYGTQFDPEKDTVFCSMKKGAQTFFHETGHAADLQPLAHAVGENSYSWREELFNALEKDLRNFLEFTAYDSSYKFGDDVPKQAVDNVIDAIIENECGSTQFANNSLNLLGGRIDIHTKVLHPSSEFTEQEKEVYEQLVENIYRRLKWEPKNNAVMASDIMRGMTKNTLLGRFGHPNSYWEGSDFYIFCCMESWAEWFSSKMYGEDDYVQSNLTYFPYATNVLDEIAKEMAEHYKTMVHNS